MFSGCTNNVLNDSEKCITKVCENNLVEESDEGNVIIVPEQINESFWDSSDPMY